MDLRIEGLDLNGGQAVSDDDLRTTAGRHLEEPVDGIERTVDLPHVRTRKP